MQQDEEFTLESQEINYIIQTSQQVTTILGLLDILSRSK
jgi:hypothetical protein